MWIIIKYYRFATLAQLAEHLIRNERVVGSNPISGSKENKRFPRNWEPLLSCLFSFENDLSMTCLKASLLFLLIVLIYPFFVFIQQLFVNFAVILRLGTGKLMMRSHTHVPFYPGPGLAVGKGNGYGCGVQGD